MTDITSPEPLLEDYMTPEELAAELGKSVRTIDRWARLRTGPPRTVIGRKPYYRRASAREWLLGREREQVTA